MKKVNITSEKFNVLIPFLIVFAFGFSSAVLFQPKPKVEVVFVSGDKIVAKGIPVIKNQILYVGKEEIDLTQVVRCEFKN